MKYTILGQARRGLKDDAGARAAFRRAQELIQAGLAARPDDADPHATLANVLAFLGEKEQALREAELAVKLVPVSKDAFHGPDILTAAAQVYAIVGEKTRALLTLEELLARPGFVTVAMLKLDPVWDLLRDDPGFQQLLARHGSSA